MLLFPDYIVSDIANYITGGINGGGAANAQLLLSNATITSGASVGTTIGTFSVVNGSTRSYTFSLTSNPGALFAVSGANLTVASALSVGSDPITAQATDGALSTVTSPFLITVTSSVAAAYVPTYELFGF